MPPGPEAQALFPAARQYLLCEPVSVKENIPPEKQTGGDDKLSEHQARGWRAVSAVGLQGRGSRERNVFFTGAGMLYYCCMLET